MNLLFVLLLLLLCIISFSSENKNAECYEKSGYINCEICSKDVSVNNLQYSPRYNLHFDQVDRNLGYYNWYECNNNTNTCDITISSESLMNDILSYNTIQDDNALNYIQGLIFLFIFTVIIAIIFIICSLLFCVCRNCCICTKNAYIRCGLPYSTKKSKYCCLGYKKYIKEGSHVPILQYPLWQTILAYFLMSCFIIFTIIVISFGQIYGNSTVVDTAKTVAMAPNNMVSTIKSLGDTISSFATN